MSIVDTFTTMIPSILSDDMKKFPHWDGVYGEAKIKVGRRSDGCPITRGMLGTHHAKENYGISGSKQSLTEMKAFLYLKSRRHRRQISRRRRIIFFRGRRLHAYR